MRRVGMLALVMIVGLALPASAQTCAGITALARLQATGSATATGTAIVFWNGSVELVPFDSQIVDSVVEQTWHFDSGDVMVTETPHPVLLNGPFQIIDSDVQVDAPDSGNWAYDGLFNESTLRATFLVTGQLCKH